MTEKLDDITVSEEEREFEAETPSVDVPAVAGGEKAKRSVTSSTSRSSKQRAAAPGFFARLGQFIRDTRAEMRRVSWPSANEVKNTTIITLIAVIFFALYLFGIDRVWAFLIDHLRVWLGG